MHKFNFRGHHFSFSLQWIGGSTKKAVRGLTFTGLHYTGVNQAPEFTAADIRGNRAQDVVRYLAQASLCNEVQCNLNTNIESNKYRQRKKIEYKNNISVQTKIELFIHVE